MWNVWQYASQRPTSLRWCRALTLTGAFPPPSTDDSAAAAAAAAAALRQQLEELGAERRVLPEGARAMRQECTERWVRRPRGLPVKLATARRAGGGEGGRRG